MTRMFNLNAALLVTALAATTACDQDTPIMGAPDALVAQASVGQGTHAYPLTAIVGEGTGHINLTPEASQEGFSVEVQASVRWTEPNAAFLMTRAVDFTPDGVCLGTTFVALPRPYAGPLELLTTSAAGAGAKHASFAFASPVPPQFQKGQQFDVHWELRTESGSTVLRSPCITVTVR